MMSHKDNRTAMICFLVRAGQVMLMLTRYPDKEVWTGIGGYVKEGETARDAAAREAYEEIGIIVNTSDLVEHDPINNGNLVLQVFTTSAWEGEPASKEESLLELRWFDIDKIPYEQAFEGTEAWLPKVLDSYK